MAPFRYRKPGYVALNVTDLDKSVHFYRDLVGLQLEEQLGVADLLLVGEIETGAAAEQAEDVEDRQVEPE